MLVTRDPLLAGFSAIFPTPPLAVLGGAVRNGLVEDIPDSGQRKAEKPVGKDAAFEKGLEFRFDKLG